MENAELTIDYKDLEIKCFAEEKLIHAFLNPDKTMREAALLTEGTLNGIGKEIAKDPMKAACNAGGTLVTGAAIGLGITILAAEAPIIGAGCIGAGGVLGAQWLWNKLDPTIPRNQARNKSLSSAMDTVWKSNEPSDYRVSLNKFESSIGKDGLEMTTALLGGLGAARGSLFAPRFVNTWKGLSLNSKFDFRIINKRIEVVEPKQPKMSEGLRKALEDRRKH